MPCDLDAETSLLAALPTRRIGNKENGVRGICSCSLATPTAASGQPDDDQPSASDIACPAPPASLVQCDDAMPSTGYSLSLLSSPPPSTSTPLQNSSPGERPEGQDSDSDTDSAKHGATYNRMPHDQLVDLTKQLKREHNYGQRSIARLMQAVVKTKEQLANSKAATAAVQAQLCDTKQQPDTMSGNTVFTTTQLAKEKTARHAFEQKA